MRLLLKICILIKIVDMSTSSPDLRLLLVTMEIKNQNLMNLDTVFIINDRIPIYFSNRSIAIDMLASYLARLLERLYSGILRVRSLFIPCTSCRCVYIPLHRLPVLMQHHTHIFVDCYDDMREDNIQQLCT